MVGNLEQLPESESDYFKEADTYKVKLTEPVKCDHYFVRINGIEVECNKCKIGFMITPEFNIQGGHIYKDGQIIK